MSKVSRLQYKNKDFNLQNRWKTAERICKLAFMQNVSALKPREISDKKNFTFVKKTIRELYPEFTEGDLRLAQDNVSDWFTNNKSHSMFDSHRHRFPNIFPDTNFKQTEAIFDTVETIKEQAPEISNEEVEAVRQYVEMGAKQVETPNGFKIQF